MTLPNKGFIHLFIFFTVVCFFIYLFSRNVTTENFHYFKETGPTILKGSGKYLLKSMNGTKKDKISWSQYDQDRFIDKLFKHKREGFFLEIGGYDGEMHSNTLFLEKERGWSGLLVESNPYTYKMMVKRDRKCYMVNACISNELTNMTFYIAGGLSSAKETMTGRHRFRIDTERHMYEKNPQWSHVGENVLVKCCTLLSLLREINHTHIDYFSLDVEGAELVVLNSIDWQHIHIDTFTIETDYHRSDIIKFMKNHGYKRIRKLTIDDVFRKENV